MTLDPVDGCTFYYTTEYLKASGSFNWSTRIGCSSCLVADAPTLLAVVS